MVSPEGNYTSAHEEESSGSFPEQALQQQQQQQQPPFSLIRCWIRLK